MPRGIAALEGCRELQHMPPGCHSEAFDITVTAAAMAAFDSVLNLSRADYGALGKHPKFTSDHSLLKTYQCVDENRPRLCHPLYHPIHSEFDACESDILQVVSICVDYRN